MRTTILLLLAFASCTATPAELATYDAIAPEYRAYVTADASLSVEQKQRRLDHLHAWAIRLGKVAR